MHSLYTPSLTFRSSPKSSNIVDTISVRYPFDGFRYWLFSHFRISLMPLPLFHTISKAVFNNHFFVAYTASWYEILWYPHQTEVFRCFKFFSVVVAVFFSRVIYRYWVELDAFEVFFEIKGLFRFARPAKIWLPTICWYI